MNGHITDAERAFAVEQLEKTLAAFENTLQGVPDDIWDKREGGRWSPRDAAEHMTQTEIRIMSTLATRLKPCAAPATASEAAERDALIFEGLQRRVERRNAPEFLQPTGRWATKAELLQAFRIQREQTTDFVRNCQEPLRAQTALHGAFGEIDGYQWILMVAGHCERHRLQIEEMLHESRASAARNS